MIFSDDAILMTLLGRYDEENEVKEAVLTYCNRGAVSSQVQKREMVQTQAAPMRTGFMQPQPSQQYQIPDGTVSGDLADVWSKL